MPLSADITDMTGVVLTPEFDRLSLEMADWFEQFPWDPYVLEFKPWRLPEWELPDPPINTQIAWLTAILTPTQMMEVITRDAAQPSGAAV